MKIWEWTEKLMARLSKIDAQQVKEITKVNRKIEKKMIR